MYISITSSGDSPDGTQVYSSRAHPESLSELTEPAPLVFFSLQKLLAEVEVVSERLDGLSIFILFMEWYGGSFSSWLLQQLQSTLKFRTHYWGFCSEG